MITLRQSQAVSGSVLALPLPEMDIATVTDPAQIAAMLSERSAREGELEEQIRAKFEAALEKGIETALLDAVEEQLVFTADESKELLQTISKTCSIAERVSSQVRELDVSRTRLQQVQERIEEVADRKDAGDALSAALASGDFEAAAGVARRYSSQTDPGLPAALVDGIEQFGRDMTTKLEEAEQSGSTNEVLRFAKLLPASAARSGSTVYAQHLRQLIGAVAKEHRSHLSRGEASGDPMIYISVLSAIFEVRFFGPGWRACRRGHSNGKHAQPPGFLQVVASVVHDHGPVVVETFGQDGLQVHPATAWPASSCGLYWHWQRC